ELGFPVVLVVTMGDLLRKQGLRVDAARLTELLDCPVVVLDPRKPGDLTGLSEAMRAAVEHGGARPSAEDYAAFAAAADEEDIGATYAALDALVDLAIVPVFDKAGRDGLPAARGAGADRVLLHPVYGLLIFLAVMCGMFTAIFWLAAPLMDGVDS